MADTPIDVNTDNLEDFEALLNGTATAAEDDVVEETAEDVNPDDDSVETEEAETETDTEEESTDSDEVEEEAEEEEEILKPKKKPSARERINELTAEKYAERRLREELERRLAALEAETKQAKPEPKADTLEAPDPDAVDDKGELVYPLGEFDPKYIAALTRHTFKVEAQAAEEARTAAEKTSKREAADAALQESWETKLAKSEEGIEDLRPTIATLAEEWQGLDPEFVEYIAHTVMGMDAGPEVLYYLANNVEEARSLVALSPSRATVALGKIEARIEAALTKKAAPPVRTKAPAPPVTTRGNASRPSIAADTDDLEAFESLLYKRK